METVKVAQKRTRKPGSGGTESLILESRDGATSTEVDTGMKSCPIPEGTWITCYLGRISSGYCVGCLGLAHHCQAAETAKVSST
ncbi:MAG: hypothetical protein UR68_C0002G0056 [Candidatus Roizmanbacteria bacterium GW2011_GWA2_35_19]|uniref:Uncharacterized protein n=1 Tax=Candidatus Roizmanbacteria bacterium GW2011_GWA2_35_19 TaxID=1618478 RepID=A0A0G0BX81_9BACT|nr:MAG: hypothetical protein UR68_C0002G0056 [Candidatus Roizmanbacteria bacterium GW2011_GWA2_35_19]